MNRYFIGRGFGSTKSFASLERDCGSNSALENPRVGVSIQSPANKFLSH